MGWMSYVLIMATCYYLFTSLSDFYSVFYPTPCKLDPNEPEEKREKCFFPAVPVDAKVSLRVYAIEFENGQKFEEQLFAQDIIFNEPITAKLNVTITERLKNNGTLQAQVEINPHGKYSWYKTAHTVLLTRYQSEEAQGFHLMGNSDDSSTSNWTVAGLYNELITDPVKFQERTVNFSVDFLNRLSLGFLKLVYNILALPVDIGEWLASGKKDLASLKLTNRTERVIPHIRSELSVSALSENFLFGGRNLRPTIAKQFMIKHDKYMPLWYPDSLSLRSKQMRPVTGEVGDTMEIDFNYNPLPIGKFTIVGIVEESVLQMKQWGFNDKDTDDMKDIFHGTNFYLLALTVFVSTFHLLFDFLAFKNDISFWRKKKDMVGVSTTVVVWRTFSTIVIMLYLFDEETSRMVLYPLVFSSVVEIWKLLKALKVHIEWPSKRNKKWFPRIVFGDSKAEEIRTKSFDNKALKYLMYLMVPLVILGALYSLVYVPHKSFYSWIINSVVNGVYAFGFLFMLPQLFVNYKLKSVAHLPWKAFMYKAFNTFIDDVFAFIVTMPTAHRLACFRDDIIFIIYLYQRYLYPVDKKRTNEYGQSFGDDNNEAGVTERGRGDGGGAGRAKKDN